MKDELGGERTRDLSLKVFEVLSGKIGEAIAQVRTARRQRRSFIFGGFEFERKRRHSVWS